MRLKPLDALAERLTDLLADRGILGGVLRRDIVLPENRAWSHSAGAAAWAAWLPLQSKKGLLFVNSWRTATECARCALWRLRVDEDNEVWIYEGEKADS